MPHPASFNPSQVLLVRHGATEWSQLGRHTGRTDLPLTQLGRDEATRLGPFLRSLLSAPPVVFTSPLQRAADTARIALPEAEAVVADSLAEFDYGKYEGLTFAQIEPQNPDWDLFVDGCPGGESPQQVAARCDSFIAKMERTAAGSCVVAFTHGHLSRILTARLLGLPAVSGRAFHNDTGSVAVIINRRDRLVMTGWNRRAL